MLTPISGRNYYLDTCYKFGKEALKTAAVIAALCYTTFKYNCDPIGYRSVYIIVGYSIMDEIMARGIFQSAIHGIQKLWNARVSSESISAEKKNFQKSFRIIFASLLYASAQLLVSDTPIHQILRVAYTFFSGLAYGHLKENTNSLIPPILMHIGRNICIFTCAGGLPALTAIFIYDVLSYYFATRKATVSTQPALPHSPALNFSV